MRRETKLAARGHVARHESAHAGFEVIESTKSLGAGSGDAGADEDEPLHAALAIPKSKIEAAPIRFNARPPVARLGRVARACVLDVLRLVRRPRQRPALIRRAIPQLEAIAFAQRREHHADARRQLRRRSAGARRARVERLARAEQRKIEAHALDQRRPFEELEREAPHRARRRLRRAEIDAWTPTRYTSPLRPLEDRRPTASAIRDGGVGSGGMRDTLASRGAASTPREVDHLVAGEGERDRGERHAERERCRGDQRTESSSSVHDTAISHASPEPPRASQRSARSRGTGDGA